MSTSRHRLGEPAAAFIDGKRWHNWAPPKDGEALRKLPSEWPVMYAAWDGWKVGRIETVKLAGMANPGVAEVLGVGIRTAHGGLLDLTVGEAKLALRLGEEQKP